MRVTDSYLSDSFINNLQANMDQLSKLNQKISTGLDVNTPSDAPEKIGRIISMRDSIDNITQYQKNVSETVNYMESSQTALNTISGVLNDAHTMAVQAANGTYSADDRATMAVDVDNKIQEMISMGNTQVEGKYIFSGFKTTTAPFSATLSGTSVTAVTYNGDSGLMPEEVNQGDVMNKNIPGTSLAAGGADIFNTLISFRNDLQANDTTAITADIDKIQAATDSVTAMNTDIGGKLKRTDNVTATLTATNTTFTKLQSSLEDVDMPEVMSNFQLQQNVYQAAITSISKMLQQTTLADILR
jgi:flagellar hook-associated protein 3 FlgL